MAVVNGQIANQTTFNNAFMSRTAPTTSTVAKITLQNPDSATVVDPQAGMNETFDAVGMTGVGDAARKNYSSNNAVANGDSHKVAIGKLDLKFGGTGVGHTHTGAPGDGAPVSAAALADYNDYHAVLSAVTVPATTGTSMDISALMAGKTPNGGTGAVGVITSGVYNRGLLIDDTDLDYLEDPVGGQRVYPRITYAALVWTLSFYTLEAGVETAFDMDNLSNPDVQFIFREVFTSATRPTIGISALDLPSFFSTQDVVDASATQRGLVSIGAQSFAGIKTLIDRLNRASANTITAFATGGQASATQLTKDINRVTVCATAGDSVKLPAAVAGSEIVVINDGAANCDVFPATGESINALAINIALSVEAGSNTRFICGSGGLWKSAAGGGGSDGIESFLTVADTDQLTPTSTDHTFHVEGDGAPTTFDSALLAVTPTKVTDIYLIGTDDTNTVTVLAASGKINGDATLKNGYCLHIRYYPALADIVEIGRNF